MKYPIFEDFQKAQQINGWKTINGAKVFFESGKVKYGAENLKEHVNGKEEKSTNKPFKEAIKNPKEGAKYGDKDFVNAQAAETIGSRFGIRQEALYDWSNKHDVELINLIGKVSLKEMMDMVLNDKPYKGNKGSRKSSKKTDKDFSNLDNFDDSKLKQGGYKLVKETSKTHSRTGKRIPYDKIYSNGDKQIIIRELGNGKLNAHLKFDDSNKTDREKLNSSNLGSTSSLSYEPSIESKKELDKILNDFLTKKY
tara:strand:- start:738 stop:1496 length:759 start_codon:yes stop_codon:yes gene_type:complete